MSMGRRTLKISSSLFVDMFGRGKHRGYEVVADWLPADTRIVNAMVCFPSHQNGGDLALLLESSEWPPIPEGQPIPELLTQMKSLDFENHRGLIGMAGVKPSGTVERN